MVVPSGVDGLVGVLGQVAQELAGERVGDPQPGAEGVAGDSPAGAGPVFVIDPARGGNEGSRRRGRSGRVVLVVARRVLAVLPLACRCRDGRDYGHARLAVDLDRDGGGTVRDEDGSSGGGYRAVLSVLVVVGIAGFFVFLGMHNIPAPTARIEKVIPNDRFTR